MDDYANLEKQLKAVFTSSPLKIVEDGARHYQRTDECPTVFELTTQRLTAEQRAHTEHCVYCSKVLQAAKQTWLARVRRGLARMPASIRDLRLPAKLAYGAALAILIVQTVELSSLRKTAVNSAQDVAVLRQEVPPAMHDIGQTLKSLDEHAQSAAVVQQSERNEIAALVAKHGPSGQRSGHSSRAMKPSESLLYRPDAQPEAATLRTNEVRRIGTLLEQNQKENEEVLVQLRKLADQLSEYRSMQTKVSNDELSARTLPRPRHHVAMATKPRVPGFLVRFLRIPKGTAEGSWILLPSSESDGINPYLERSAPPGAVFRLAMFSSPDDTTELLGLTAPGGDFDLVDIGPIQLLTRSADDRPKEVTACSVRFK